MKVTSLAEAKMRLSHYVAESSQEPVLITKNGKPAALLLPVAADADLEGIVLSHSPRFQELIRASRESFRRGEGIPHEEFWERVEAEYGPAEQSRENEGRKPERPAAVAASGSTANSTPAVPGKQGPRKASRDGGRARGPASRRRAAET